MNEFLFFPFTFMDACQARTMACFFERFGILDIHPESPLPPPMSDLEASGALSRIPVDTKMLAAAKLKVRAWLDWAAINRGNEKNLRALIRETTFLKDDSGVAAIRSDIRSGIQREGQIKDQTPEATPADQHGALVFLQLAHMYDFENQEIQNALDALDAENDALFAELKGEGGAGVSTLAKDENDPGLAMTLERIKAWWSVAFDAGLFSKETTPVLITASRAVMDEFCAGCGKQINTLDIKSIKVHHNGCELTKQRHLEMNRILTQMAAGQTVEPETTHLDDTETDPETNLRTGQIQIRFYSGDQMKMNDRNPGGQVGVCLVELNS